MSRGGVGAPPLEFYKLSFAVHYEPNILDMLMNILCFIISDHLVIMTVVQKLRIL